MIQPHKNQIKEYEVKKTLIDGGSSLNLIPSRMIEKMKLNVIKDESTAIKTADGGWTILPGYTWMQVTVAAVDRVIQVSIVPGNTSYSLLLGRPWLRQVRAVGYYEYDEYWIKDRFGNEHKLTPVTPPKPVPSPQLRLSAEVHHDRVPYDEETVGDLELSMDGDIDKLLEHIIEEANEEESDEEEYDDNEDEEVKAYRS